MATSNEPKVKYWGAWLASNGKTYRVYTIYAMRTTTAILLQKGQTDPKLGRMDGTAIRNPCDKHNPVIGLRFAARRAINAFAWRITAQLEYEEVTHYGKEMWDSFRLWLHERCGKGFSKRVAAHIVAARTKQLKAKKEKVK